MNDGLPIEKRSSQVWRELLRSGGYPPQPVARRVGRPAMLQEMRGSMPTAGHPPAYTEGLKQPPGQASGVPGMRSLGETAAVLWRTLAIQCIKRHYVLSFLELLIVLVLALVFLSTNFIIHPTNEPGRRQASGTAGAWLGIRGRSPANLENQMLVAAAFPGIEILAYLEESVIVRACSLVEFVVCVHFAPNTAATLAYTLHYFEGENPGKKGLDIGFRHPREFYYEPDMDRPLWGTAYMTQVAINTAYLKMRNKDDDNVTKITVKAFPVPDFPENIVRYRYGLFWLAAATLLFPMYRIITRLCAENNSGLREYQLMMGLRNCFYWTGHFSCALCFFVVHSALCVYSTVVYAQSDTGSAYLDRTDPSLLFVALLIHSVSQILLAMLAACVFTSVTAATVSTVMVSVVLPYWVLETMGSLETLAQFVFGVRVTMLLSCALPTVAAYNVLTILAIQNDFDGGAVWQKVHYTTLGVVPITVVNVWAVSAMTMAVMILLIGYLSNVLPWNTAHPLHPLFFFKPSYWRPHEVRYRRRAYALEYYDPRFERAPSDLKAALEIVDLSVSHGNSEALKGVSLQAFHNQATVLVGRNGAGKTTLMNAIAGLQTPSGGMVRVYGYDVAIHNREARVLMSYCPQRDIHFPDMTSWEHLLYFGALRDMNPGSLKRAAGEVMTMILVDAHALAHDLKRRHAKRLSIGIAAISKPKLVVIDEPTAGMDPADARIVWEILLRLRGSVSLFFSTHNMTEADVLADRVVCLSAGIVICNASPSHLKYLYGEKAR
ncbi:hypothetical protein HPB49_022570 [Dermacentor silvarum]|uniref:Uncharacterized protein n=1 Tax=Dermacentor silvarum TaxID=543639 RepID=A0ACB8DL69_DERSI|nr:hypothetical protein HPB49_022570 [Dermacentor silvarum]